MKTRRFLTDIAALLGTGPFEKLWLFFKYFQLFKVFRVFRIKDIISKSNASKEMKAVMNLGKIFFYLVMYLHILACYWYLIISINGPMIYYRIVDDDNKFKNMDDNDYFLDEDGVPLQSDQYEAVFGTSKVFKDAEWTRKDPKEYLNAEVWNKKWEGLSSQWYTPTSWVNTPDARLFTKDMSKIDRYFLMLYYAIIMQGVGEMGPINAPEIGFCVIFMPISLILQAQIFSDIAVLVQTFFKDRSEQQEDIDKAFELMIWIELDEKHQKDIKQYFTRTASTKVFQEKFEMLLEKLPESLWKMVSKNLV